MPLSRRELLERCAALGLLSQAWPMLGCNPDDALDAAATPDADATLDGGTAVDTQFDERDPVGRDHPHRSDDSKPRDEPNLARTRSRSSNGHVAENGHVADGRSVAS